MQHIFDQFFAGHPFKGPDFHFRIAAGIFLTNGGYLAIPSLQITRAKHIDKNDFGTLSQMIE